MQGRQQRSKKRQQQQQQQPKQQVAALMGALPSSALQHVLALATEDDLSMLHTAPLVCRAWCAAIRPPLLLRMCHTMDEPVTDVLDSALAWLRRGGRGAAVETLVLVMEDPIPDGACLEPLLTAALLPRLRSLTVSGLRGMQDEGGEAPPVCVSLQQLPQLTSLQLCGVTTAVEDMAAHLPQLEAVAFQDANLGPGAAAALARLTHLRSLTLVANWRDWEVFREVAGDLAQLTQLTHFKFGDIARPCDLAVLTGLRQLADLDIFTPLDGATVRALAAALTALTSFSCHNTKQGKALLPLAALTRLRSLDLSNNRANTKFLLTLSGALTQLTRLNVSFGTDDSDDDDDDDDSDDDDDDDDGGVADANLGVVGIAGDHLEDHLEVAPEWGCIHVLKHLTALAELDVSGFFIGAAGAQQLAGVLPNVGRLSVQGCSLGPQGLAALTAGLTQLTYLELTDNGIGGEAASAAALQSLTQLQGLRHLDLGMNRLRLEECMPLTALTGLTYLGLARCRLSEDDVEALQQLLPVQADDLAASYDFIGLVR